MINSLDIFCHIVDNFGDIGVVYRFVREFRLQRPMCVIRVYIDNLETFQGIEPRIDPLQDLQVLDAVTYVRTGSIAPDFIDLHGHAEVVVEAFGCEIPAVYMDIACQRSALWINLEHLSGEEWVPGYHLKESLMGKGSIRKFFFMPGFTADTGGVIIDSSVEEIKKDPARFRPQYLELLRKITGTNLEPWGDALVGTVFSYEKRFTPLLRDISGMGQEWYLLIFGEKSQSGITDDLARMHGTRIAPGHWQIGSVQIFTPRFLKQQEYDLLLCFSDFNIVRGEDSLVRAMLSAKPFIWHAYIQEKGYQVVKVEALLEKMRPFFRDETVFKEYFNLMTEFNRPCTEAQSGVVVGGERFVPFLKNRTEIKRATADMSYFITQNCSLVDRFIEFIEESI